MAFEPFKAKTIQDHANMLRQIASRRVKHGPMMFVLKDSETENLKKIAEILIDSEMIAKRLLEVEAELERLRAAASRSNDEICQILGKALGYPWFKDDQKNFPGAAVESGVCVGEHVAETLAVEAAEKLYQVGEYVCKQCHARRVDPVSRTGGVDF